MKEPTFSFFLTIACVGSALAMSACVLETTGRADASRPPAGEGGQAGASGSGGQGGAAGGSGGQGGGVEPCGGACVDPNAACVMGVCTCGVGFVDTEQAQAEIATCEPITTIEDVKVSVGIGHGRLGNLVLKLQGPTGEVLTLMSRPGWIESEDNNTDAGFALGPIDYGPSGDQSDLVADHPINFLDSANVSAEEMGRFQDGNGLAVCRDKDTIFPDGLMTPVCDYAPNKGATMSFATFAEAFGGRDGKGQWRLCVGDADGTSGGRLESWSIDLATLGGPLKKESAKNLALDIADNVYNGSFDSMRCHTLVIP